jgi:hypothetical protein
MKIETPRVSQLSQLGDLLKKKQLDSSTEKVNQLTAISTSEASEMPEPVIYLGYSDADELGASPT